MRIATVVSYAITGILVLLILLLLVGQVLGQPLLIFVETGSMEPTLNPGDGYVAIPHQFSGEIEAGDVILFDAQEIGDGGLTTHRVEAVTDEGYVTKGDANPFPDQEGGEPIVTDGQVRSVALQPGGSLLVIPRLGTVVETFSGVGVTVAGPIASLVGIDDLEAQSLGIFVLTTGLLLLILSTLTNAGKEIRSRVRRRRKLLDNVFVVIAILTLVIIIPLNISMLMPAGVYSFEIVSSPTPSETTGVIEAGSSEDIPYTLQNSGYLPTIIFLEPASPGVEPDQASYRIAPRSSVEAQVTMTAPEETGTHLRMVREYRYLMLLPPSVISALHAIHPFLAIAAINAVVTGVVALLVITAFGTGRDRSRVRTRSGTRLHQILR